MNGTGDNLSLRRLTMNGITKPYPAEAGLAFSGML
jgi:hypothetical protein